MWKCKECGSEILLTEFDGSSFKYNLDKNKEIIMLSIDDEWVYEKFIQCSGCGKATFNLTGKKSPTSKVVR